VASDFQVWLEESLASSELTDEARTYLLARGAKPHVIDGWGVKVFDVPDCVCPDQGLHKHYGDRFQRIEGKIIFPLRTPRGELVGFDSRTPGVKDDMRFVIRGVVEPIWVGMPSAMERIWSGSEVVIVEGTFDVFAMHHLESDCVILGAGPARLGKRHLTFLKRWAKNVALVFDQDETGKQGSNRAAKSLTSLGVNCRKIPYVGAKDPGEIWDQGGAENIRRVFSHL
jgi:DNA primase